mmetsp:Transcript_40275/g.124067  ORF Transcript_40275/g.124067 Transcript_40275/m.124067 type:complete len:278 (+) Transcript_40275:490-1323(+)
MRRIARESSSRYAYSSPTSRTRQPRRRDCLAASKSMPGRSMTRRSASTAPSTTRSTAASWNGSKCEQTVASSGMAWKRTSAADSAAAANQRPTSGSSRQGSLRSCRTTTSAVPAVSCSWRRWRTYRCSGGSSGAARASISSAGRQAAMAASSSASRSGGRARWTERSCESAPSIASIRSWDAGDACRKRPHASSNAITTPSCAAEKAPAHALNMPNTLGGETSPNRTSSPTYAALRSRAGKSCSGRSASCSNSAATSDPTSEPTCLKAPESTAARRA